MTATSKTEIGPQATYEKFLSEGRFMIQKSQSTQEYVFFPRAVAPSGATDLVWVEACGDAVLHAITLNRTRQGNNNVALVQLEEGVRMMSTLPGVDMAPIGARLRARVEQTDEKPPRVVFDLIEELS